jgi:hypothetical protein
MATERGSAPDPVIELASPAETGEHWWPVALAIIVAAALHVALPARYRVQPTWVVPVVLLGLLAVLIVGDPGRIDKQKAWLRIVTGVVIAFLTLANLLAAGRLVVEILTNNKLFAAHPGALLAAGGVVWATNVIAFGLWYWDLDRGGAAARAHHPDRNPACPPTGCPGSSTTSRSPSGPPPRSAPPIYLRSDRGPSCS